MKADLRPRGAQRRDERRVAAEGLGPEADLTAAVKAARADLVEEVAAFARLFGPINSICAHGDTRVPWARNLSLVEDGGPERFGVRFDANNSIRQHALGVWLTDRSAAEGHWGDGHDPHGMLLDGVSPLLCLTHPNNWVGGPDLWRDRLLARTMPVAEPGETVRVLRTRRDDPPAP